MIRDNYLDIAKIIKDRNILKLFRAVENYGGVLRFVGGCVRDAIVGIEGSDLDLATDLSPDELVEACQDCNIKTVPIGIKYGTVGVVIGQNVLEVTSLRKDIENDGRHPVVEFTADWSVDASRRDLTINAVYADEKGNVFDYYNGIDDLENGIVRFIGDPNVRIKEDYLRILRFFRFYSAFGKVEIDSKALKACIDNEKGLKNISAERIRDELRKILITPNVVKTLKIMFENNILKNFMPFTSNLDSLKFLIEMFDDTKLADADLRRLFVLINPDKERIDKLAQILKLSRKQKSQLAELVYRNISIDDLVDEKNIEKFVYLYGKDFYINKLLVSLAIEKCKINNLEKFINKIDSCIIPIFQIRGKDLLEIGVLQQQIGQIINVLEQIWVDSSFKINRDELLAQVPLVVKSIA